MRGAVLLIVYSVLIITMGVLTYLARSPGSNAFTAVLVPLIAGGLCISSAIALLLHRRNRGLAKIAVIAAYALPALVAIGSGMRVSGAFAGHREFVAQQEAMKKDAAFAQSVTDADRKHDTGYQAVGIASIAALSLLALAAIIIVRPALPPEQLVAVPVTPREPVGSLSAAASHPSAHPGAAPGAHPGAPPDAGSAPPMGLA